MLAAIGCYTVLQMIHTGQNYAYIWTWKLCYHLLLSWHGPSFLCSDPEMGLDLEIPIWPYTYIYTWTVSMRSYWSVIQTILIQMTSWNTCPRSLKFVGFKVNIFKVNTNILNISEAETSSWYQLLVLARLRNEVGQFEARINNSEAFISLLAAVVCQRIPW